MSINEMVNGQGTGYTEEERSMEENRKVSMIDYVQQTPAQIRCNVERSKELTHSLVEEYLKKEYRRILIIACGSSYNGSLCSQRFVQKITGKETKVLPPFSFVHFDHDVDKDDFIVVVSQSGRSTNAIEALNLLKEKGLRTIGITSDVNSDFKDICDLTIDWGVGVETVGYVTKGVVTLAAYFMLFAIEAQLSKGAITTEEAAGFKNEILKAMDAHEELQDSAQKYITAHEKELYSIQEFYVISAGSNLATATEAALKISETVRIHATAYECEEFLHGPVYPMTPRYSLMAYDTADENANQRIEAIYEAAKDLSLQPILVRCGVSDDPDVINTSVELMDEVMPLAYLAVAPLLADFASHRLEIPQHPLLESFQKKVATKSLRYPKEFGQW